MNETELRALIRDAVTRHLGPGGAGLPAPSDLAGPAWPGQPTQSGSPGAARVGHPSQALYLTLSTGVDGCLIEPAVGCTHCGYCKTHGY